jgi:hypothetical protein
MSGGSDIQDRSISNVVEWFTLILGGIVCWLGFPHAFLGWPALSQELSRAGVDAGLRNALGAGWVFGSVSMFALGTVVVLASRLLRAGVTAARWIVVTIGEAYFLFGLGAGLHYGFSPHFVAFTLIGTLLLIAMLLWRPARA